MKTAIVKPALLVFLCLFSSLSQAFEYFMVNRAAEVFTDPGGKEVMSQLAKGNVLLEIDKQGEWSKVFFLTAKKQPLKGWVLSKNLTAQQQGATRSVSEGSGEYYTVTVAALRLRRGPGSEHPVVGGLKRNQMVKQLHRDGEWIKVRYRNESGKTAQAWTAARFLQPAKAASKANTTVSSSRAATPNADATISFSRVKGTQVNFRSGPGSNYRVVGQLSHPQEVEVIASQKEWKKIRTDLEGKQVTGWIVERLLEAR
ncbi:SH3 domain-containing protein [Amphritea japonica]|uniref:N-acetylmuramoyl-L-alanine amidase n=1 Tax=Amphritea japonica ATCC BAA-1530 TaxID=1278309 RepID=A0A7R6PCR6_9GAMM|nr:SH3 domain-containing protein [Amphritea japonica]BBB26661.1 N-acetylmuramoyl-L-alanine amidase [Amphritea japonica ATCC BAA-1530]